MNVNKIKKEIHGYNKMSKPKQIESLIDAGVYNVNKPGVVNKIRLDFYGANSDSFTPENVVRKVQKRKNAMKVKFQPMCKSHMDKTRMNDAKKALLELKKYGVKCSYSDKDLAKVEKAVKKIQDFYKLKKITQGYKAPVSVKIKH